MTRFLALVVGIIVLPFTLLVAILVAIGLMPRPVTATPSQATRDDGATTSPRRVGGVSPLIVGAVLFLLVVAWIVARQP